MNLKFISHRCLKTEKSLWVKYRNFTKFVTHPHFQMIWKIFIYSISIILHVKSNFWSDKWTLTFLRCNGDLDCCNPCSFSIGIIHRYMEVLIITTSTPIIRSFMWRSTRHLERGKDRYSVPYSSWGWSVFEVQSRTLTYRTLNCHMRRGDNIFTCWLS